MIFFGALVVCAFALVLWTSLDFQECVKSYGENKPSAEHLEKGISAFVVSVPTYRHCVGAYVTDKNPVITAVGTLIIAVFTTVLGLFTISLAGSTRIAANAASKSADAVIAIELPLIRVNNPDDLWRTEDINDDGGGQQWNVDVPLLPEFSRIYGLKFRNLGRTTASPTKLQLGWEVTKVLSVRKPRYNWERRCDHGSVIPSNTEGDDAIEIECVGFCIALSEQDRALIQEGKAALWVFGALTYLDFLDLPRTRRFCWKWGCPDGTGLYYFHTEEGAPAQYTKKD